MLPALDIDVRAPAPNFQHGLKLPSVVERRLYKDINTLGRTLYVVQSFLKTVSVRLVGVKTKQDSEKVSNNKSL